MQNLLSMEHLSTTEMMDIIHTAIAYKKGESLPSYANKTISNLFFENSTRTKLSFEMAEHKLNIHAIPFEVATSSVSKGETLYDTCKTLEAIGVDALVIRHPENEYYRQLKGLNIPIINGGDGSGSHPTQCLLDLMTIYEHFGYFEGLNVVIVGDISHSRVARSNQQALTKLGASVSFAGPKEWQDFSIDAPFITLDEAVAQSDVIMLLRVQRERHTVQADLVGMDYNTHFGMNAQRLERMKENAIIMHPAPINRGVEITDELVECEKSKIFEQMTNGVYTRMAVLNKVLGG